MFDNDGIIEGYNLKYLLEKGQPLFNEDGNRIDMSSIDINSKYQKVKLIVCADMDKICVKKI